MTKGERALLELVAEWIAITDEWDRPSRYRIRQALAALRREVEREDGEVSEIEIVKAAEMLLAEVAHTVSGLRLNGVMTRHADRLDIMSDVLRRAIVRRGQQEKVG